MSVIDLDLDAIDFAKGGGTVPVIAQDRATGSVLMLAYADRQALQLSKETGELHFRSRTRGLWRKGETSGNTLSIVSLALDCDNDTVLAVVRPKGPACHTGAETCFGARRTDTIRQLVDTIAARAAAGNISDQSYTARLLADRNLRMKKLGEEMTELVVALCDQDHGRTAEEAGDVLYHLLVSLQAAGVAWDDVLSVLQARAK